MEEKNKNQKSAETTPNNAAPKAATPDTTKNTTETTASSDTATAAAKPAASETPKTDEAKNETKPATEAEKEATDTHKTDSSDKPDTTKDGAKITDVTEVAASSTLAEPAESGSNRPLLAFVAGVITALVAWQVYTVFTTQSSDQYPNPIATVNGEAVDQSLFLQNVTQTLDLAATQGVNIEDATIRDEIEAQALETIINTRLLVTAASEGGFEAGETEINEQIASLETQFGGTEGLNAELERLNLSREDLRRDVGEQIAVDNLLATEVVPETIEVTDEEVQVVYDDLVAAGQELPEIDTIRDAIVAQVEQQKQQELVEAYLEELRAAAEIEINL